MPDHAWLEGIKPIILTTWPFFGLINSFSGIRSATPARKVPRRGSRTQMCSVAAPLLAQGVKKSHSVWARRQDTPFSLDTAPKLRQLNTAEIPGLRTTSTSGKASTIDHTIEPSYARWRARPCAAARLSKPASSGLLARMISSCNTTGARRRMPPEWDGECAEVCWEQI